MLQYFNEGGATIFDDKTSGKFITSVIDNLITVLSKKNNIIFNYKFIGFCKIILILLFTQNNLNVLSLVNVLVRVNDYTIDCS